eukprot:2151426-Amphidinium_carterae.1
MRCGGELRCQLVQLGKLATEELSNAEALCIPWLPDARTREEEPESSVNSSPAHRVASRKK